MKRFLKLLIAVPLAVVLVAIAVANRAPVTLSLDPISREAPLFAVSLPLFVLLFAVLLLGILIGGAATWLRQGKWRRAARTSRREARDLRRDLGAARIDTRPPEASTLETKSLEAMRAS